MSRDNFVLFDIFHNTTKKCFGSFLLMKNRTLLNTSEFLSRDTGTNINISIFSVLLTAVLFRFFNDRCLIQSQTVPPWSKNNDRFRAKLIDVHFQLKVLPPFSLIRDFGKQNTGGNVSKISVSLACNWQIGSKSTNHSHYCNILTFSTSCYRKRTEIRVLEMNRSTSNNGYVLPVSLVCCPSPVWLVSGQRCPARCPHCLHSSNMS